MPPIACKTIVNGTSLQNMSCPVSLPTIIALIQVQYFVQQLTSTLHADNFARWWAAWCSPLLLFALSWCLHTLLTVLSIFKQVLSDMSHRTHTLLIVHSFSAMFYKFSQPTENDSRYTFLCYLCINIG